VTLGTRSVVLGLDTGSPVVSVAAVDGARILAERAIELRRSSELLIGLVDEVLREAGASPADVRGVVALRGPGSFTGLRVGLATALAFRQALGCAAAAPSSLQVLAAWARQHRSLLACRAVVEGVRGEWACQSFRCPDAGRTPVPFDEIARCTAAELRDAGPPLVGFGVAAQLCGARSSDVVEPGPLAASAAQLAASGGCVWDASELVRPLYLAAPATTSASGGPRP
jgi:tRNA threonylcarbamoyl adenosine modification protein YeaZ